MVVTMMTSRAMIISAAIGDANDDKNSADDDRDGIAGDNPPVTYVSGDDNDEKL